jgi:hypothetical protein
MSRRCFVDSLGDDARLGAQSQIAGIDVQDLVHVHEAEHKAARARHTPAAQACS